MTAKSPKAPNFESAVIELEQIIADIEAGKLSLESSLAAYKRGTELLLQCRAQLEDAQQQVQMLDSGVLSVFSANGDSSNNSGQF